MAGTFGLASSVKVDDSQEAVLGVQSLTDAIESLAIGRYLNSKRSGTCHSSRIENVSSAWLTIDIE